MRSRHIWARAMAGAGAIAWILASGAAPDGGPRRAVAAGEVCSPVVALAVDRERLPLGASVTVDISLDPNCRSQPELRHLALVLQPTGQAAADAALGAALADLLEDLGGALGPAALISGEGQGAGGGPRVWPLQADHRAVVAGLRAYGAGGAPQSLDLLLRAARSEFLAPEPGKPKPLGRRTIAIVAHRGAEAGRASALELELEAAREDAIEVLYHCLGVGCPALPGLEPLPLPDAAAVAAQLGGHLRAPALPGLVRPRLYAVHGTGVRHVPGTAQPAAARMGWRRGNREHPYVAWDPPEGADRFTASLGLQAQERGRSVLALPYTLVEAVTTSGEPLQVFAERTLTVDTESLAPLASNCRLRAQTRAPAAVGLDEALTLDTELDAVCAGGAARADIVLVADRSASMQRGRRTADLNQALGGFLEALDLDLHRVAVVDLQSPPRLASGLSQDRAALLAAVAAGRPAGDTELGAALDLARQQLEERRAGALPLVILLTDGASSFPQPGGDDPWLAASAWLQEGGAQVFVACLTEQSACEPRLASLASSPDWFRHSRDSAELSAILLELADRVSLPGLRRVVLSQALNGAFFSDAPQGSDDPLYLHQRGGYEGRLLPQPLVGPLRWSDTVWARALGRWPVADRWELSWIDAEGLAGTVALSSPEVLVSPPVEAGPCRLDITRHDPTPPETDPAGIVLASTQAAVRCEQEPQDLELVLLLDHSDSMRGQRIADLRAGVDRLLTEATAPGLRLGMVAFSDRLLRELPLGTSAEDLRSELARTDPQGTTNIGQALNAAGNLLKSARPGAKRLVFLLTDGRNSTGPEAMLAAADRLKGSEQVELAALCLAQACDADLRTIVSRPGYYMDLADSRDLMAFFSRFAAAVAGRAPVSAELREQPGAAFEAVPGSAQPAPAFAPDPHVWQASFPGDLPFDVRLNYLALWPGRQPLSLWSRVDYQYIGGRTGRLYLGARPVTVRGEAASLPTAAPLPPTATRDPRPSATATAPLPSPTPPSPQPSATRPAEGGRTLYLPVLAAESG